MIREGLETEIEELTEEVKRMANAKFTRGQTIIDRMQLFKETRQKCEMYADLLHTDAEILTTKVDQLRNEVQQALDGELAEYPQSGQFPIGTRVEYSGKTEKFGTTGIVVGYFTSAHGKHYVKIKFDKTKTISPCSLTNLQVITPDAAA
ncbi:MAG: hypothetical protein ACWGQW_26370, partial [bacterium]